MPVVHKHISWTGSVTHLTFPPFTKDEAGRCKRLQASVAVSGIPANLRGWYLALVRGGITGYTVREWALPIYAWIDTTSGIGVINLNLLDVLVDLDVQAGDMWLIRASSSVTGGHATVIADIEQTSDVANPYIETVGRRVITRYGLAHMLGKMLSLLLILQLSACAQVSVVRYECKVEQATASGVTLHCQMGQKTNGTVSVDIPQEVIDKAAKAVPAPSSQGAVWKPSQAWLN